jgi:predicted HicB family RNase H-like nuclease
MTRGADEFKLRLPDGMRDKIAALAMANGRSMNAEIVQRLAATLNQEDPMATNMPQDDFQKTAIRIPQDLHALVHGAASSSGRSYNAELIMRISQTFPQEGAAYPELASVPTAALLEELGRRCK